MNAYVIRRLLVMIPTFFGITLIIFGVLNLAPGRPGSQQSSDLAKSAKNEQTEESYRIFREQFHLDKPVLFNTRFSLRTDEVLADVKIAAGTVDATAAEKISAQERLEDWGAYAVAHLVTVMDDADHSGDTRVRDTAVYFLRLGAMRPLVDPFDRARRATRRASYNRADRRRECRAA